MAQQAQSSSTITLYPNLEASIEPLDTDPRWAEAVKLEKELISSINKKLNDSKTPDGIKRLLGMADSSLLPHELITTKVKRTVKVKPKSDPLKRIKELANEDVEDEEVQEEEVEEEEEQLIEDEEDDAGGDYLVSHFDNGEGFEDNEDEGDDMTSMI